MIMENVAYLLLRLPNALYRSSMPWQSRPVLYPHLDRICPQLQQLEIAYPAIKQEYLAIRDNLDRIPRYHDVDRLQCDISSSPSAQKNWKVFFLEAMGRKAKRHLCSPRQWP
jgi:hypothetical protein